MHMYGGEAGEGWVTEAVGERPERFAHGHSLKKRECENPSFFIIKKTYIIT